MAYETKALLIALGEIVKSSKTVKEAYEKLSKVANAEGVLLDKFEEDENDKP